MRQIDTTVRGRLLVSVTFGGSHDDGQTTLSGGRWQIRPFLSGKRMRMAAIEPLRSTFRFAFVHEYACNVPWMIAS